MAQPRSEPTHARPRAAKHPGIWTVIAVLLIAVVVATLWVPSYNRTTPSLGGWPFFYWYQLAWVPIVALVSWLAYLLSRRAAGGAPHTTVPAPPPGSPTAPGGPAAAPQEPGPPPLPKRQVPPPTEGG